MGSGSQGWERGKQTEMFSYESEREKVKEDREWWHQRELCVRWQPGVWDRRRPYTWQVAFGLTVPSVTSGYVCEKLCLCMSMCSFVLFLHNSEACVSLCMNQHSCLLSMTRSKDKTTLDKTSARLPVTFESQIYLHGMACYDLEIFCIQLRTPVLILLLP